MYDEKDIQDIVVNRAKHFEPKSLQNFKANRAKALAKLNQNTPSQNTDTVQHTSACLDDDIIHWLLNQDTKTKRHINDIIRQAMQLQQHAMQAQTQQAQQKAI